jgi:tetratricopeptide (TPR) repeat protein
MKKLIPIFLLINVIRLFAEGEAQRIMEKGNSFYQNNQFEQAIDAYEKVLQNGYESKSLYYNLGNAYFRTGKIGYSILNYEKALKFDPNDEDINYNLKISDAHTVDKIETLPKLFFISWWEALVNLFSTNGWLMVLYTIFLLVLITATIYFLSRKAYLQRWSFLSGIALVLLFAVSLLFYILKFQQDTNQNYAVVIESSVTVKTSPDDQSNDAFIIHEGLKLKLSDQIGNWYKIQLADGKVGWLQESNIKII